MSRMSLDEAVKMILDNLPEDSTTPYQLSKNLNLNWKTVVKAVKIIEKIQRSCFEEGRRLVLERVGKNYVIRTFGNLGGLTPEQRLEYVRRKYFPEPETSDLLFAELLRRDATSPEKAVAIQRDALVSRFLRQGQFAETPEGKIYLTDEGILVAEGTLDLYPELR